MSSKAEKFFLTFANIINFLGTTTFILCLLCSILDFADLSLDWFNYYPWTICLSFLISRYIGYWGARIGIFTSIKMKADSEYYWRTYVPKVMVFVVVISVFWGKDYIYDGIGLLWLNSGFSLFVKKHWYQTWGK